IEPITTFPIAIDIEYHLPIPENESKLPDIDNMSIWWRKVLQDALAGNVDYIPYNITKTNAKGEQITKKSYLPNHADYPPKIPDDNITYITEANNKFVKCDTINDRKLVITIRTIDNE